MKNKIFATLLALTLALSLTACGSKSDDSAKADTTDDAQTEQPAEPQETVTLNVAASPTPHAEILKQCVPILAEQGIDLQIHEYSDYVVPNTAVEDGDEDANYFQHVPYLDDFNTTRGTHLVSVTGVHIEPMGIYAGKSGSLCSTNSYGRRVPTAHPWPSPMMPPTKAVPSCCWKLRVSSSWLTTPTSPLPPRTSWRIPRT